VICCTLLEHVEDTGAAIRTIASLLKKDGLALVFIPSRKALFARLNLLLPEALKRRILFGIFPEKSRAQGFPSFYDSCSPKEITQICVTHGLTVVDAKYYFTSSYFSFFVPLYVIWRLWLITARWWNGNDAAETFSFALRRG
jgi:2-polyprenyl-3-methyl-5-hydroxy-6-metoxy-1,4-benzoquinol methylase